MSTKARDSYFDNLRGFLIICVIIGNSLEYINPTSVNPHYLILSLYMFHMPLFTFISGYFCKKSKRDTKSKVIDTVKIYLSAQIFYYLFNMVISKNYNLKFELLKPSWTLWYLLALIFWYIISDYIDVKNYKKSIVISIIISLILGFDPSLGTLASGSRVVFFLPFFIAGLAFEKEDLEKLKKHKFIVILLTICVFSILFLFREVIDVETLFEYTNYTFYIESATVPFLTRCFHFIGAFTIGSCILMLFPSKKCLLSWIGKNSLILYVAHSGIIKLLTVRHIMNYNNLLAVIISETLILLVVILFTFVWVNVSTLIKRNLKG